ncbi:zinc finger Y-chromosomal protein 1-like isoform X2 [Nymphalis io]|uniref:zinc finger Y-chromosomal protein 1-like isoform X2 n=1 Tax=Inachis io TaxID=171585 RepID=UPI002169D138|nr:zinc finger Y-chromosomal protein 1-like isoform X2 [Nymphalis io]
MEENNKKRSRKTKLVPREYLDSDDENIAQMQNEIEETISKINVQSILRKLEPKYFSSKSLEFSVKVEVEECNENIEVDSESHNQISNDLNIKINSIRSLNDTQSTTKEIIQYYQIDEDNLREVFYLQSKKTISCVDKMIEIYIRNNFGRQQAYIAESNIDKMLQMKLKKWKLWYEAAPELRDSPIMYICYVCNKGWWHFSEFREHLKEHDTLTYGTETPHQEEFRITAYKKAIESKNIQFESDCWKCGRDVSVHQRAEYRCRGCKLELPSCTMLCTHENDCKKFKMLLNCTGIDISNTYYCPLCPYKHWVQGEIQKHLLLGHSVRSDLPIHWTSKPCPRCDVSYNDHRVHECPHRPMMYSCEFCKMTFQVKPALQYHLYNSKHEVSCRICNMKVLRECMLAEHLLVHTSNYTMMFKCILCVESLYFKDYVSIKAHKKSVHADVQEKQPVYEKVIMPTKILDESKLMSNLPEVPDTDKKKPKRRRNLVGNKKISENTKEKDYFQDELGIKVTVINKLTVQKLTNDTDADENNVNTNEINKLNIKRKTIDNTEQTIDNNVEEKKKPIQRTYTNTNKNRINKQVIADESENSETIHTAVDIKQEILEDIEHIDGSEVINDIKQEIIGDDSVTVELKTEVKMEADDEMNYVDEVCDEPDLYEAAVSDVMKGKRAKQKKKKKPLAGDTDQQNTKNVTDRYTCTKCNSTSQTLRKYLLHFKNHNYKELSCPKCFKQFPLAQSLLSHVNAHIKSDFVMIHSIRNWSTEPDCNYQCRKCKMTLSVSDFFEHWERHLEIQDISSEESDYNVNMDGKPMLKNMLEIIQGPDTPLSHEDMTLRMCLVCNKRFERRNDCKRHYIEHLLTDAYSERDQRGCLECQLCGRGFLKGDAYKRHMRDHARLPIYKCEICDKTFSDSSNFCKHKKVHNMSVLVCDICKKKFSKKAYLIKHLKMHQVVKPIMCKTCDKLFYSQSSYSKHLKRNKSRFKCPVCASYYMSLKEKWDHMWEVHNERKYEADCPLCNKSFRKFLDVKHHLREDHDEKQYLHYKSQINTASKARRIKEIIIL